MKAGKGEFMPRALVHESVTDEEGGRDGREELVSPTSEADFSVPFFLRAVQFSALNEAKVEIRVQYKDVTSGIFKDIGKSRFSRDLPLPRLVFPPRSHLFPSFSSFSSSARNELVIRIQPFVLSSPLWSRSNDR